MILLKVCNFRRLFYILYKIVWGVLRLSIGKRDFGNCFSSFVNG